MITVTKITPPTLDLFAPDGTHLGNINEYEFLDACVKIKREQLPGYYAVFKGKKVRIDRNGRLEEYPEGLLDTMSGFYCHLLY